eukprot:2926796-Prymnesium_polylepis.1
MVLAPVDAGRDILAGALVRALLRWGDRGTVVAHVQRRVPVCEGTMSAGGLALRAARFEIWRDRGEGAALIAGRL